MSKASLYLKGCPVLAFEGMPGFRVLPLRQATNTAIALETSLLRQPLHYLTPSLKGMPGPRILPLRQARKTAIASETSPLRQTLHHLLPALEGMPGPSILLLR